MQLFLVRHAESEGNAQVPGATIDCGLTDLGQRQAEAVAERLAALGVDRVLASPYVRTLETAQAIQAATGAPAEAFPLLHEHHFQAFPDEWPLLSRAALANRFPAFAIPEDFQDARWHTPPETDEAALRRAGQALDELRVRFAGDPDVRLAIVSHGSPTGKLILAFLGVTAMAGLDVTISNASLSILEERDGYRVVHAVNRVDHLDHLRPFGQPDWVQRIARRGPAATP